MAKRRFKKGDIVTLGESMTGWLITGTQIIPTLKGKKRYFKLKQLPGCGAPHPGVEGLALSKDLFL